MSKSVLGQVKLSVEVDYGNVAKFSGFFGASEWVSDHSAGGGGLRPWLAGGVFNHLFIFDTKIDTFLLIGRKTVIDLVSKLTYVLPWTTMLTNCLWLGPNVLWTFTKFLSMF